ncbi:MAG TPA: WD40 repeat domain-containing protein, partial [Kofleriaceae bacterium]|nr:WD40 repeat domain-containing protein [Kofleriaceae bacterium]
VAVVLLLWMNGRTERQRGAAVDARRSAEESLVRLQVELGREALLARDYARAAAYLGHAAERGVDTPALRFLLTQAVRPLRLRSTVLEHGEKIGSVTFSPDGSRLVTAGEAEHAVVWSAEGKRLYDVALGGGEVIMAPRFSPDGRYLLLTGRGGTVGLWNAADGKLIARQKAHDFTVWTGAFSPDGARFATVSGDQLVKVWSTATVQPVAVLRGHEANVLDLAWTPDGTRLVTTGVDGTARVWDPARGTLLRTLVGDRDHISRTVAVSPDGALVALGSDRVIKVWRLADGALVTVLSGHAGPVEKLAFARDGRLASASWDGTAKVWNATGGGLIASLEGHKGKVWSVIWSSDASRILTISEDGTGRLWDSRGVMLSILSGHASDVEGGAIDPTGRLAATASFDGTARLWPLGVDTTVGLAAGHAGMVAEVRFSEDGSRLITTSRDRTARVWDVATGIEIAHFDITYPVAWAAGTGPDLTMAVAEDRALNFFGRDGKPAGRIDLPISVDALESTPDGARLLLMAQEGDIIMVDVETRALRKLEVGPARWATFARRGPRIAVAHDDGRVEVWDSSTGKRLLEVSAHDGGASRVQFCGDDARLVSVGHDGAVKFWDAKSGAPVRQIRLKPGYLAPLVSPDCAFLFSAGDGYPLAVLDATDGRLLDHIEVRSGETLNISMSSDGRHLAAAAGELAWTWDVAVESDLAPLLEIVRCAAPFRIEGSELVVAPRNDGCAP